MTPEGKLSRIRELWYQDRMSILSMYEVVAPHHNEEWEEVIEEMNKLLNIKE